VQNKPGARHLFMPQKPQIAATQSPMLRVLVENASTAVACLAV